MTDALTDGDGAQTANRESDQADESFVEYCISNVDPDRRVRIEASDATVRAASCLQRCGRCYERPFLVLDGEFVAGDHLNTLERAAGEEP